MTPDIALDFILWLLLTVLWGVLLFCGIWAAYEIWNLAVDAYRAVARKAWRRA